MRVVTLTVVLSLATLAIGGTFLYRQIANNLVGDRMTTAGREAKDLTATAQSTLDAATSLDTASSDLVKSLASAGEQARYVVFTRTDANTGVDALSTVTWGPVAVADLPTELRAAVNLDRNRQHLQVMSVRGIAGEAVSAVAVGQQVTLEAKGKGSYALYFIYPMTRERDTINLVGRWFALGGVLLTVLVAAVAFVVTRMVVHPVREAAHTADRFAVGRFSERMPVRGHDDLARLASSFNVMAESLQRQIGQLEDLSRVQQRFVSDVSHELRTPLTTVRMAAEVIYHNRHGFDQPVRRSTELLYTELDRFEALLSDLLEISRFDAGAAAIEADSVDLTALARRVMDSAGALAHRAGTRMVLRAPAPDQPVIAEVDARRVERIVRNLVVNAIEHGEGRDVEIAVAGNRTGVALTVCDHGVGLGPGEAELVFTRFWRADPARARTTGGTGLGLSIAQEDARLHGGQLEAWGERGVGSCFRLVLPRVLGGRYGAPPLPLRPEPTAERP